MNTAVEVRTSFTFLVHWKHGGIFLEQFTRKQIAHGVQLMLHRNPRFSTLNKEF
jgi:hypothetical protein